jgi:sugar phosphate isomerase/epimerase
MDRVWPIGTGIDHTDAMPSDTDHPNGHRLVLAAGSVLDLDPLRQIEVAAAAGFWGLGLRLGSARAADRAALDGIAAAAQHHGVILHDLEVIRIPADGTDPAEAEVLCAAAGHLGIGSVLAVSDHESHDHTVAVLRRIAETAATHDVEVVVEYMAWTTPATPRAALEMAAATGCRIVVDVLHHHRVGGHLDDAAAIIAGDHFAWLQLCDGPLDGPGTIDGIIHEARHARATPGHGEFDLTGYLGLITAPSIISVEVQSDQRWAQITPAARAAELYTASVGLLSE